ncbi:hypothetical protein AM2010_1690 [Pelagerythrobacter marensis]|uniref:FecR protein domain-containing protein n=1 Tax=Pelagerythrobacter marensis TaxID=543877 RepID=A0A0G3XAV1_9SPHN|nr:hypothetical protein AM2010_1690 [Pelagerythrobacter marensis]
MVNGSSAPGHERCAHRKVRAQAALWTVLAPDSSADDLRGLARWLADGEDHAQGYTRTQAIWDDLGDVLAGQETIDDRELAVAEKPGWVRPAPIFAMAASLVLACMIGFLMLARPVQYGTDVGEQRVVSLADGSRVTLNTSSQIAVRMSDGRREISLEQGEALFDVAPDPARPFIVRTADRYVQVLGTTFSVRRDERRLDVVVLHGSVEVGDADSAKALARLRPGDRFRERASEPGPILDRPDLEVETAWRNGELMLDQTPLGTAVREMNRYSETQIVLADPGIGKLPISGVFRTGDSASFARTISLMYGLKISKSDETVVVER